MVTELAERGELTHLIRELGKYNPLIHLDSALRTKEVLQFIVSEILGALEYMHSVGVSHRDLKPENILLTSQTRQVILFLEKKLYIFKCEAKLYSKACACFKSIGN